MALAGVAIGLGLGLLIPPILTHLLGSYLPIGAGVRAVGAQRCACGGLRSAGGAAVYAVAAGARRARACQRAVPRRGGAEAHAWPAPRILALIVASAQRSSTFAVLTSDSKADRVLFRRWAGAGVPAVLGARRACDAGRAAHAAAASAGAGAGNRQSRRAGRADALRRAVARCRFVAARRRGAGGCIACE